MPVYRLYGSFLRSNIPLPELPQAEEAQPDAVFELGFAPLEPERAQWIHHSKLPDGTIWLSLAGDESGYLLRFPEKADFLVSDEGCRIRCLPACGIPAETVRHLFLDQVLPFVLSSQGKLVLHASAVLTPAGAVAFVGATGLGKSTLTASFCRQGFPLLTDDGLLLENREGQLFSIPSYPGLRLWDDSAAGLFGLGAGLPTVAHYTSKLRVSPEQGAISFCAKPAALRRIYFLAVSGANGDQAIAIVPLPGADGFMELVKHAYCLDSRNQARLREQFQHLQGVVALPLLRRLLFPHDLARLRDVQEVIRQDLQIEDRF